MEYPIQSWECGKLYGWQLPSHPALALDPAPQTPRLGSWSVRIRPPDCVVILTSADVPVVAWCHVRLSNWDHIHGDSYILSVANDHIHHTNLPTHPWLLFQVFAKSLFPLGRYS